MRNALLAISLVACGCPQNSSRPPESTPPPAPVRGASVTLKGATVPVEYLRSDQDRRWPVHSWDVSLPEGGGRLTGWPRNRILYLSSLKTIYDVAFLAADGTIVETAQVTRDDGITSTKEARWALVLPSGWLAKHGARAGDAVAFSKEIQEAPPRPMPELSIGGAKVQVELSYKDWERSWGLSHRRAMSPDDGMLFIYRSENDRRFWMGDCHFGLDIAFFDAKRRLLNVVSIDPYPDPKVDPGVDAPGGRAPSAGPAQFVLEVQKGWFRRHALVGADGKPVRELTLEAPESVVRLVDDAD
jgi:uncharacterized membrane protein (UPF0127 family)